MAKFQRRHYEDIAASFSADKPIEGRSKGPIHHSVRIAQWERGVQSMVRMCLKDNHRFDVTRFRKACGLTESSVSVTAMRSLP